MLFMAPTGAGVGAWLGTMAGSPLLVAVGLVVGSILGGVVAHATNVAITKAAYEQYHHRNDPW
jgi:hypothetical protein